MKKTRALLLSILLMILAFTSCNLDGTSGIFREIANAKTPLSIRYEKLLGYDATPPSSATYHYYWISTGIYRFDSSKTQELVAANPDGDKIHGAALYSADNKVFYITNDEDELSNGTIRFIDTETKALGTVPITSSIITLDLEVKNLYANSMILVKGKGALGKIMFEVLEYTTGPDGFRNSIATFPSIPDGYELQDVIQQTTLQHDSASRFIVSFVTSPKPGTGVYEHHLVDHKTPTSPTNTILGKSNVKIANFLYHDDTNLYILTTSGVLYHVNQTTQTWTEMTTVTNTYRPNAFVYAYDDGSNYHLIAKPSTPISNNFPLDVLTFVKGADTITSTVKVSTGYAQDISEHCLISAIAKSSANLLVATEKNGMFEISISNPTTGAGTSSAPEEYTF